MKHPVALSHYFKKPLLPVIRVPFFRLIAFLFMVAGFGPSLIGQTVYFEIKNEVQNGSDYDFDVYMYADQLNTYHSRGQVYMYYDTAAFGQTLVNNGKVTFQHLTLLNGIIPPPFNTPQYTTTLNDNGNRVVATWGSAFGGCDPASVSLIYTIVPDTPTPLYHFTFRMKDPSKPANILFDGGLMGGQQFFVNPNPPPNPQPSDCELPYSDGILPILLSDFHAMPSGVEENEVKVTWATSMERNSSHFVLERRIGNNGTFKPIAMIPTMDELAGGSYTFIDKSAIGKDIFYQLKSVNMDGHFAYSHVIHLHRFFPTSSPYTIYPNPTNGLIHIQPMNESLQVQHLSLYDMQGRLISQTAVPSAEVIEVDLATYPKGIYLIELQHTDGSTFRKQVIRK